MPDKLFEKNLELEPDHLRINVYQNADGKLLGNFSQLDELIKANPEINSEENLIPYCKIFTLFLCNHLYEFIDDIASFRESLKIENATTCQ